MVFISILLFIFLLIAYPIIGYQLIKAFLNENKSKRNILFRWLIVTILVPGVFWRFLPGSNLIWTPIDNIYKKADNLELTGHKFIEGKKIYDHNTPRDFHGDGYSISIFEIDVNTAEYFKNPDETFFKKHPYRPFRKDWEYESWKKTPFESKEQTFLDFAYHDIENLNFTLNDLLNEKGNYYGYQYYLMKLSENRSHVMNIDFFIICPIRKIIVRINRNT